MPSTTTLPSTAATAPLPPVVQNALYSALMTSRSIPTIQATLTHELQASGWTTNLRAYIQQLLRSGECATYNEVMAKLMEETRVRKDYQNGVVNGNGVGNGNANGNGEGGRTVEEGGILIPEKAVREGVRVVRRELERVLEVAVEGE
ncbi:uncharacterized protein BDZ99DRAFT_521549 [Mytilinidion resinicola]|uniref:Uncharacterized protein n=1 Tax=Mytilinidion resinicola TaxID=574789 RepID=A0A6A6YM87_9PEZI|nr:uncharacterized protein BDZ99DRAFT_521549 [Mytilinidion resinicola]KAF2809085.1 hypothetical protein BDZ99DRAFT_521549 [Mytilinidion resinicola]